MRNTVTFFTALLIALPAHAYFRLQADLVPYLAPSTRTSSSVSRTSSKSSMAPLGTVSSRAAARRSSRSASYGSLGPISEPGPPPGEVRVLPPATPLDRLRQEVLTAVNAERTARGLAALTLEETLSGVAQKHAEDMDRRRYLSHTSPEGKGVEDRLRAVQYFTPPCNCVVRFAYGENIAKGQQTTADVVKAWMASPLHKENILKKDFKAMGLGFIRGIWVQVFGAVHVEK